MYKSFDSRNPPIQVLLVDDAVEILEVLQTYLEDSSFAFNVFRANRVSMALDILKQFDLDLIITDWSMPEMNGFEFLQILKSEPKFAKIPVIMCTGIMISSEHLALAMEAGSVDFLRKPVDPIEFLARIHSSLELYKSQEVLRKLNQSKDLMFDYLAHDLLQSVGQLDSRLHMASQAWIDAPLAAQKYLNAARQMALEEQRKLNQLLEWARYRFMQPPLNELVSPRELFEELRAHYSERAKELQLELQLRVNPEWQLQSNYALLLEFFRQCLLNAFAVSAPGKKIKFRVSFRSEKMQLEIEDSGPGLSNLEIDGLLLGENWIQHKGFGLKICSEIASLLGAEMYIQSRLEQGSIFGLRFSGSQPFL
jgi:two-component system, sensor histidine kinase and response regulator